MSYSKQLIREIKKFGVVWANYFAERGVYGVQK